jgi:hypothetical protein
VTDFNDEREETVREDEEARTPSPCPLPLEGERVGVRGSNRPLLLAGIALVMMLLGYAATTYVPEPAGEQERRLAELRQMDGMDDALRQRLDRVARSRRPPPYQLAGQVAIFAGVFLFIMAGVLMYRSPPRANKDEEEDSV